MCLVRLTGVSGLLASLWQFPQRTLSTSDNTTSGRKASAVDYVSTLEVGNLDEHADSIQHVGEIGSIVHVFSHLKLTMHVQHFQIRIAVSESLADSEKGTPKRAKWVATEAMDEETLSTGMRRCWDLVTG
ncbi:hypothetical protein BU24DRAFT_427495 [Aaosphaeria arxii CBS 175.79]|uniref:Adenine DNA glycosylase n=1 Tax=Aaosphaeria arxii CBS 175.79 TaxID=1450172 RepID=A0A6A5XBM1_9PLEO|nr:uncharacterized protein BU24DRAFT_427495 [Aaosphaeria arxii CBS 175.79]KAF2010362.1 hypothetical protein BU24DRAFT_427495 [Aaosphaeria arxii CBS 175.79]